MGKLVYLFELDSTRNSDEEIIIGQEALVNEIVHNGNSVVLTFNQLVDSRGFFSLLASPSYFDNLVRLFENGAIRISQYGDIRTISQYLLASFETGKDFKYSGWPLKSSQRRLIALIKRSLMYSDLSEIIGYTGDKEKQIEPIRSEEELKDLFIEVCKKKEKDEDGNIHEKEYIVETEKDPQELMLILEKLRWLLKTILRLSSIHSIYIAPRDPSEYKDLKFSNILDLVTQLDAPEDDDCWDKAIDIIKNLSCYKNNINNRTSYVLEIYEGYKSMVKKEGFDGDFNKKESYQYAEAIIDLVYNYTCEISMCDISKHYNVDELRTGRIKTDSTFAADFSQRLKEYWNIGCHDEMFLLDETNDFKEFKNPDEDGIRGIRNKQVAKGKHRIEKIEKNLAETSHVVESFGKYEKNTANNASSAQGIHRYEYMLEEQENAQYNQAKSIIWKKKVSIIWCFVIVCGLDIIIGALQNVLVDLVPYKWFLLSTVFTTVGLLFLSEKITDWLAKNTKLKVLSLSESIESAGKLRRTWKLFNNKPHNSHKNSLDVEKSEPISTKIPVDFIASMALKKYMKMIANSQTDEELKGLFDQSSEIPFADGFRGDSSLFLKRMTRFEEVHNQHYGVIYESKYNQLVVDPIKTNRLDEPVKQYERIIPVGRNGTVMVTVHDGKFVLLRQFRHAPRKEQYSFPRGHNEEKKASIENALKELNEEINANTSKEPVFLGNISPDSGLTSACADVYLAEVDSFSNEKRSEGIREIVEITEAEFIDMIEKNGTNEGETAFDDGYTIAAYVLYKNYMRRISA